MENNNNFGLEVPRGYVDPKEDSVIAKIGKVIAVIVMVMGGIGVICLSLPILICVNPIFGIIILGLGIGLIIWSRRIFDKKK